MSTSKEKEPQPTHFLTRLEIRGLFDRFDYDLDLHEGGVTIITGPNGYGKTTIMEGIYSLGENDATFFDETPFTSWTFHLKALDEQVDTKIIFARKNENVEVILDKSTFPMPEKEIWPKSVTPPFIMQPVYWVRGQSLNGRHVYQGSDSEALATIRYEPWGITNLFAKPDTEESRLDGDTIRLFSSFMAKFFETVRNFPSKVDNSLGYLCIKAEFLEGVEEYPELTPAEYQARREKVEEVARFLRQMDLLPYYWKALPEELDGKEAARSLVIAELIQSTLKPTISLLELFQRLVNERLMFKKIVLEPDGFSFVSDTGRRIEVGQLSSGEKQEVVCVFELAMRTSKGALVLFDEPEISRHVALQKAFLSNLRELLDLHKLTAVVATHSPQIINGNWDLVTDLEDLYR